MNFLLKTADGYLDKRILLMGFCVFCLWIFGRFVVENFFEAAAVYAVYYSEFSFGELVGHLTLSSLPADWPTPNLKSHVYDFSVLYEISRGLDVINAKPVVMPENILPYGPGAFLFYDLLDKIFSGHILSLFFHQIAALTLFFGALFISLRRFCSILNTLVSLVFLGFFTTILQIFILSGNIEVFVFSMTLLGISLRPRHPRSAIVFICLAASIKYYPAIFLLLFLKDGDRKLFLIGCLATCVLIFPFFLFLQGGFFENFLFTFDEIQKSSRLCDDKPELFCAYGGLSIANIIYNFPALQHHPLLIYRCVVILIIIICGVNFFASQSESLSLLSLVIAFCLIPQVSVFYKLSYLLIFILAQIGERKNLNSQICMLISLFCLSPIPFFFNLTPTFIKADFSLLFVVMLIVISIDTVRYRMSRLKRDYSK